MVRTLTPPAQKGHRTVLLPGATGAEPWEVWSTGPGAHCLRVCQKPGEDEDTRRATLALPVSQVMALSLWLLETDAKQFRGMIALQLESRGLQQRGREAIFEWSIVTQEPTRTLVLVGILPALLPEDLEADVYPGFEVSARCLELPNNALVLWKEQDGLVLAVTRNDRLAYFQALTDETLTKRTIQDVTSIVASLEMQEVIETFQQVVLWFDATPAEVNAFQALVNVPVRQQPRTAPSLPRENWNLTPARVGEVKRKRVARRWWSRVAGVAILLVLALAGFLVLQLLSAQRDIVQLKQWQAQHAASLQMVHDTEAAWRDLRPVVATESYPLEVLLHVSESLPADDVHLTLFETEGDHVLVKAEAKNLTAAFQFFDSLKKNPHLPDFTWEMAQPHSLANDITQVQIEGIHASHD